MLITAVRASWLRAPIPADRAHVSDFGRNDSFNMCLVEIETDAGITGLGEAKAAVGNLGNYGAIVTLIREEFAPLLIGRDPRDITGAWELLYNGSRAHYATREGRTFPTIGRRGITLSAITGVDIALWDMLGRSLGRARVAAAGRPLSRPRARLCHRRLGAGRQHRQADAPVRRARPPRGEAARRAPGRERGRLGRARGARCARRSAPTSASWWTRTGRGACARRSASRARSRAHDLAWFEEPVSPDNLAGQAEVRRATDIPIAAGESEQTRFAFREMLDARAVDVLQPDPAIAGGITETQRIAALAASHGLTVAPHLWGSAILFATGLHLCVSTPCATMVEFSRGHNPLLNELVEEEIAFEDGHVLAPSRPGLGLTLRRDFVKEWTVAV